MEPVKFGVRQFKANWQNLKCDIQKHSGTIEFVPEYVMIYPTYLAREEIVRIIRDTRKIAALWATFF